MSDRCCDEHRCTRAQPILLRESQWIPGVWFLVTRYRRVPRPGKPDLIEAQQKHRLDAETCAALTRWRDATRQSDG